MRRQVIEKLEILADAAKYDASCASSGGKRENSKTGIGNSTGAGICHSYTEDGRCVSLLKVLFSNVCIYDCAYCVSRRSNDVERVAFTVDEVVELTMGFYKRNYIEGLFLSSGIFKDADTTTEKLVAVARKLRYVENFNGYIHLKVIPGASPELLTEAGRLADRLSVNVEIPSEEGLKQVAPEKDYNQVFAPMGHVRDEITASRAERKKSRRAPRFAAGGQSTQLVVGATPETDRQILELSDGLYSEQKLRRVYYSGFVPLGGDDRVPDPETYRAPLHREHRLYQADWLIRKYGFGLDEVAPPGSGNLDSDVDPKTAYALRYPDLFPVDVNRAPIEWLQRVPGLGIRSSKRIIAARRRGQVRWDDLRRMGVVMKRAQHFLTTPDHRPQLIGQDVSEVRRRIVGAKADRAPQLSLFAPTPAVARSSKPLAA
ncbi:putative DNA modification/repair radical SAM protein [Rubrivirga sp.]|uniref:putative DNA modification/repair radical SAM protein n=1 Tax=Rubrivirga sp. TaxID=1885344 RepID=UPI003C7330EE